MPAIGVAIEALTRKPVRTQLTADGLRVELLRERGQRGDDQRLRERERDARGDEREEDRRGTFLRANAEQLTYRLLLAIRRARSLKVVSTSSSIVRRKTASSAWAASGRTCSTESASSSQRSASGVGLHDVVHEQPDEVLADRAGVALDAGDQVERVVEADPARDRLLGGLQQRGARDLEVAVAERGQDAELDRPS